MRVVKKCSSILLTLLLAIAALSVGAQTSDHNQRSLTQADIFEKIKLLKGSYLEDEVPEDAARVTYEHWSRDSAVMEAWEMPTKREFTIFHMDNEKLVATHYCGGNIQVTLDLVWPAQNDTYEFRARYVSNHASSDAPYNSGFSYKFQDDGDIWRNEYWITAGETSESALTLVKQPELASGRDGN